MIHPTRTNLLLLKDKSRSVLNSIGDSEGPETGADQGIHGRDPAVPPFAGGYQASYGKALRELALALGHEGKDMVESIVVATEREFGIDVIEKSIWGLRYKDIVFHDAPVGMRTSAATMNLGDASP